MARRFQNQGKLLQSFYPGGGRGGVHNFATHLKPGAIVVARDEREAEFWNGMVRRGILTEVEPSPDPPSRPVKAEGPWKFKAVASQLQRFNPPWLVRNWDDTIDLQPGEMITVDDSEQAEFWRRACGERGPLVEITELEVLKKEDGVDG